MPVGVGDPSNNWLGSSVGEHFPCDEVVPGLIPGLAYYFLFLQGQIRFAAFPISGKFAFAR